MATECYRIEILSPLHIGSGDEYGVFDGAYQNGRWYLIDIEKVLQRSREDPTNLANAMMARDFNWADWLQRHNNITPQEVAVRSVACHQNPAQTKIRACIRDPFGRPYIPGSTLKGAIRTAILEWLVLGLDINERKKLAEKAVQCDEHGKLPSREWVGREVLERKLLIGRCRGGNESNYDLLRALHVADSEPLAPEQVEIGLAWVYTLSGNRLVQKRAGNEEYKMFLEWLPTGIQTRLTITLDKGLLQGHAKADLGFRNEQVDAMRQFKDACNERADSLIESERRFYEKYELDTIARFYQELQNRLSQIEAQGGFMLNIGWGGGWETKTVTNPLTEDLDEEFKRICQIYRLGKQNADVFPKTRRVAFRNNQPYAPLGWVALIPESQS